MNLTFVSLSLCIILNTSIFNLYAHGFVVTPVNSGCGNTIHRSGAVKAAVVRQLTTDDDDDDDDEPRTDADDEGEGTYDPLQPSSLQSSSSGSTSPESIPLLLLDSGQKTSRERRSRRRTMELSWCSKDTCQPYQNSREKVVGENNDIEFDSPATGQVVYNWDTDAIEAFNTPRILILVKRNDDELMATAADAVRELFAAGGLRVMLQPEVAAKFKHYFGVDDDKIELFENQPEPGFGGSHLGSDDPMYNSHNLDCDRDDNYEKLYTPDLVVTLGGDGLLMYASTLFPGPCPPILCVSGGSLGFLTPFSKGEMVHAIRDCLGLVDSPTAEGDMNDDEALEKEASYSSSIPELASVGGIKQLQSMSKRKTKFTVGANNQICLSLRMRLECQVLNREGIIRARFNVLNEVVIDRGDSPYLAALECFCDDVHLTTVQADGVIFSTPTGSTAYSMSAGGPVAHPALPAIFVTPICPHVLSFRSMVFPDHVVLRCFVAEDARADAAVTFDGKYRRKLNRGDNVLIRMSPYPVPTINRVDHSADWLTGLKRNFNFNTRVRQAPL